MISFPSQYILYILLLGEAHGSCLEEVLTTNVFEEPESWDQI